VFEGDPQRAILCVGDSFTEGVGAAPGYSYPHQLGRRLAQGGTGPRVINAGHSGQNSAELLESLPELLHEHRPRWVAILVGTANTWDFYGFREGGRGRHLRGWLRDRVANTRLYRLGRLLGQRWRFSRLDQRYQLALQRVVGESVEPGPGWGSMSREAGSPPGPGVGGEDGHQGPAPRAHRQHARPIPSEGVLGPRPPEIEALVARAEELLEEGDRDRAEDLLYRAIDARPVDARLAFILATHHGGLGEKELAEAWAERAIMASEARDAALMIEVVAMHIAHGRPYKARETLQRIERLPMDDPEWMDELAASWEAILAYPEAARWLEALVQARPERAEPYHRLAALNRRMGLEAEAEAWEARAPGPAAPIPVSERFERRSTASERWLAADLITIVELVEEHGATPLLQTFPNHAISSVTRDLAQERGLPLVDHQAVFTARPDASTLFVPDGHCNNAGYQLMAETLAAALEAQGGP
jgi:lysophospholipase L1-like esterase